GQWGKAAEDFTKGATFPKASLTALRCSAFVALQLKDSKAYRETCARLLEKWQEGADPKQAVLVAWTCSAQPDSGVNLAALIEKLTTLEEKDYACRRALGAALFRSGKTKPAIDVLLNASEARKIPSPGAWLFLAMACHDAGQKDDARRWLEK